MLEKGFDTEKYLEVQSKEILERVKKFKKLYLEFGGKICYDFHAARVLPGYDPNAKIRMLQMIKEDSEIIFCVSSKDIESGKIRGDFAITYESATLKSINDLREFGLDVSAVVITRFFNEEKTLKFKNYLENLGITVYIQREIENYPNDLNRIVSKDGYGSNPYIQTTKPIVVVTGAGPGSGKMSVCLSQLYHDSLNNQDSGFAKFETFPVWDLPLEHPVNLAYEAATADIGDVNLIDPFHLEAYNVTAINYNRDIENFPILKSILIKIRGNVYNSPTEMGVSKTKAGIINDEIVCEASKQEIVRRYFRYRKEAILGLIKKNVVEITQSLMQKMGIDESYRKTVIPARQAAILAEKQINKGNRGFYCGSAIEISGKLITGKNSELLHSESACVINALKQISNIPDEIDLLSKNIIEGIRELKRKIANHENPSLDVSEILIALAISSSTNPAAAKCLENISLLKGCEMHSTHLSTKGDENGLRELGINVTTDAVLTPKIYFLR